MGIEQPPSFHEQQIWFGETTAKSLNAALFQQQFLTDIPTQFQFLIPRAKSSKQTEGAFHYNSTSMYILE